jgi:putative transposase
LLIAVVVHAAHLQDRDGAKLVLQKLRHHCLRLVLIWADGGYVGSLAQWLWGLRSRSKILLEIVKRCDAQKGFKVLPHRWIVERTFAWLGRYRRLSKDYEFLPETSEAFIKIAMIDLMLRRLAQHSQGF